MRISLSVLSCSAVLTLAATVGCSGQPDGGPELILTGGRIWVGARADVPVTALAIADDRVIAVGDDAAVRALAGDDTQELPLDGATVTPGLADAWVDVEALGRWQESLDLRGAATLRELQAMLRGAAPDADGWIVGWGWDEGRWPSPELPGAGFFEAARSDVPILLYRRAGRIALVNDAALRAAGIENGGTGLVGDPQLRALEARYPPTDAARRERWSAGLQQLAAAGVTRAASGPLEGATWDLLRRMQREGDLLIRIDARLRPGEVANAASDDDLLRWGGYAVELDGPFRPPLALLNDGAADVDAAAALREACDIAAAAEQPLAVHAHGDLAVAMALDCPSIGAGTGLLVGADLLPVREIPGGVRIAVVPGRLAHDLYFLDSVLGPERSARLHRYRDLAANGTLAGVASMAPAYALDPLGAVHVMLARRDGDGFPLDGWHPGQRLGVADSLEAAMRSPLDGAPARLDPGAVADMVIWSQDPLGQAGQLTQALPMMTIVAGRVVYSRPWSQPAMSPR